MRKMLLSYILLFVMLAASVLCAVSCERAEEKWTTQPEEDADCDLSGCLFIGDSRTYGLEMTDSLPGADFFCYTGWTVFDATSGTLLTDGEYLTLSQLLSVREYKKVYILFGINEIGGDLDAVTEEYSELISLIRERQPEAKIVVQANPHVTTARSSYGDAINNERIDLLNQKLRGLTDGFTVLWLDATQILDDSSGGFNEAYAEEDGLHPNWDCYVMWGAWIVSQSGKY